LSCQSWSVSATIGVVRVLLHGFVCTGLFGGLCALAATASSNDPPEPAPTVYTLSFPERRDHRMHVEIEFAGVSGDLRLRMSRSSPGRYAAHDFARNVDGVTVFGAEGGQLRVTRPGDAEWLVRSPPSGGAHHVRVRYRVFGDRLDGTYLAVDPTHAHINIPAALMWAVGRESDRVRIRIQPPDASWRVATQLFPTDDPFEYTAPNFHYLVDSPIEVSDHLRRSFVPETAMLAPGGGQPPTIALALHHAGSEADVASYLDGIGRIVREQAALFGEYPAYDGGAYTFIADFLPTATHDGMEHRNSAVLTGESIRTASHRLLGLAAHEFFHAWNVERIRPRSLEPFNLFDVNPSGELWLAEGFSQYYEALTMVRAGLWTLDAALENLGNAVSRVMTFPEADTKSAEEMSCLSALQDGAPFDPRGRTAVLSHYALGAALALGFDFTLRDRSAGERSLDDFMSAMWRHHGRLQSPVLGLVHAPYTLDDVQERLAEVSSATLAGELIGRFVRGRERMDYRQLLARAGLRLEPAEPGRASLGAILLRHTDAGVRLDAPPPAGSPAARAGLSKEDAILRIGGRRIDNVTAFTETLASRRPGELVAMEFEPATGGPPRTVSVRLDQEPGLKIVRAEADGGVLGEREKAFRAAWLTPSYAAVAAASAPVEHRR
jgi:predicted metalloprotease with PDZ domain